MNTFLIIFETILVILDIIFAIYYFRNRKYFMATIFIAMAIIMMIFLVPRLQAEHQEEKIEIYETISVMQKAIIQLQDIEIRGIEEFCNLKQNHENETTY